MSRGFTASALLAGLCVVARPDAVNAQPTLREIARFGSAGSEVYFEHVLAAAVFEGDRVAVLDRDARRVALITLGDGGVRWIGGPGEGPGEFARPLALYARGDTLVVADFGGALSAFDFTGDLLGTAPVPEGLPPNMAWWRGLAGGVVVGDQTATVSMEWPPRQFPTYGFVVRDANGVRVAETGATGSAMVRVGGDAPHSVPGVRPRQSHIVVLGDTAVMVVDGYEGVIRRYAVDASGALEVVERVELPVRGRPFDPVDLADLQRKALEFRGERRPLSDVEVVPPELVSPILDALADEGGRVWLHVTGAPERLVVRDTDGGWTFIDLPEAVRPLAVRGHRIVAVHTDALDVHTVVVFALER